MMDTVWLRRVEQWQTDGRAAADELVRAVGGAWKRRPAPAVEEDYAHAR